MKTQLRIFTIFAVVFFASFLPEAYPSFFGDWLCQGSGNMVPNTYYYERCNHINNYFHNPEWHWGFRHYVWMLMGATLAIYNIIMIIVEEDNKNR